MPKDQVPTMMQDVVAAVKRLDDPETFAAVQKEFDCIHAKLEALRQEVDQLHEECGPSKQEVVALQMLKKAARNFFGEEDDPRKNFDIWFGAGETIRERQVEKFRQITGLSAVQHDESYFFATNLFGQQLDRGTYYHKLNINGKLYSRDDLLGAQPYQEDIKRMLAHIIAAKLSDKKS